MIHIITAENRRHYHHALMEMHRQRKEVFIDQMKWRLEESAGIEIDAYDCPEAIYLIEAAAHSVVSLDLKGELHSGDVRVGFPGTAGWRAKLGPVLRFDPTSSTSDRFNLIDTIRPGPHEVRDVQNLTELIADPYGDQRFQEFWDRAAKQVVAGVILHVAYAEPEERKNLYRVFELLARFDDTVKLMEATLHRLGADGNPETHPEVRRAAQSYAAYHEKLRAGIKATAEFPLDIATSEAPPLFLRDGSDVALVNYRVLGNRYVIDRLFDVAVRVRATPTRASSGAISTCSLTTARQSSRIGLLMSFPKN